MGESGHAADAPPTTGGRGKIRAVGVAVGLTVLALILSGVVGVLFAVPLFVLGFDFESTAVFVTLLLGGQIGFFAAGYLYVRRYGLAVRLARPDRRDLSYAAGGTIVALVFATGASIVLEFLGLTPESVLEGFVTADPLILIWLALLSIVVVAPAEEYLFRGVIQGRLRNTFGPASAIVVASLLFGSMHFGNWTGSLATVVGWALLITGVGVVMGVLYERTNNLTVPIIAHAVYNCFLFIAGYLLL
ncbi:CPBP family intramembrane glutamic endopeptidase [Natrononativus amylolyticus]|uniref:CPBP family intramembrane glutamic endopeptidase n=1 Tax=Natrononativus amylolyticus TaxID=2963434 RepID=UPI0020CF1EA5|nr:type II CAAX endopeptidase family protein [Natrononativus amylolyticus]